MKGRKTDQKGDGRGGALDGREREAAIKKQRLAEQLRQNLLRRKAQTRARRDGEADQRHEGLPAARPVDEDDGN